METATSSEVIPDIPLQEIICENNYDPIKNYYAIAGPDYEVWSRKFNMHFGYARTFWDFFFLERMLDNMSDEVIAQLHVDKNISANIADLGCGVGAVARHTAKKFPLSSISAITISPHQVVKCNSLNKEADLRDRIHILQDNFENLSIPNETFTHAYALESACHAGGSNKELFIAEMARTLKKGGRFCIADGFLKPASTVPPLFNFLCKKVTSFWAVPCFANINEFLATLSAYGLRDIQAREISWRIAPSVMYVPWTCLKFFALEIWRNKSLRMEKERWNNVYAPVLGMLLGLYRNHFGYYIISGSK